MYERGSSSSIILIPRICLILQPLFQLSLCVSLSETRKSIKTTFYKGWSWYVACFFSVHHLNNLGWHLAWWRHIHQYHHYLNHHQNLCKDVVVIVISSPPLDFVVDRYIVNTPWLLAPCLTSTRCRWWGGGWGMRLDNIYAQKRFAGGVCGQFCSPKV